MIKNKMYFLICFAAFNLLMVSNIFSQKKIRTIVVDAGHGGKDGGAEADYENSMESKEKNITLAISLKLIAELKKQLPNVNIVPTRTYDVYQNPREKARLANEAKGDLFLCIHADAGTPHTARRQIGTKEETRYTYTYAGKGHHKKRIAHAYTVTVPEYQYYKLPVPRRGTSVWIFAPHKTSDKLKAIMDGGEDYNIETDNIDSTANLFDFTTSPEGRALANIYVKRFQERSDKLATYVMDEIRKRGRPDLGVNQRQKGIWVLQATNMPAILVETGFINNDEDERYLNSQKGQQEIAEAITTAVVKYKEQIEGLNKQSNLEPPIATQKNITPQFETRPNKDTKILQVKNNHLNVALYDDGEIDGDKVSVFFNNELLVKHETLSDKAYNFSIDLIPGKTNELVMYADNLGSIPPNTALMVITDGSSRYEVRLAADLKNNASVRFQFKSPN